MNIQVVQGGEKRAKALTVVKRVRKSRQPSLPQQIQQHSQQQQQQQQLVIKNTIRDNGILMLVLLTILSMKSSSVMTCIMARIVYTQLKMIIC